ncbi:MAG: hypothetical protein KKA07_11725 [Bacteroidetes bacterium]|nr:hypothetical protein [Bacteroidota bacterium]MBU1719728.1 hypothetical protein [Bacteroidota bacterium]
MRKIEFEVPENLLADFAAEIADRNLANSIIGATDDKKVVIEIRYERDDADLVDELEDLFEELNEE